MVDLWPTVHAERVALVADLEGLPDERWGVPSLCAGWSVRDVLAHMTGTAKITPVGFFGKMLAAGGSFHRLQARDIARERGDSPGDTLAAFRGQLTSTKRPPGPRDTMLGETIVHAEDIRRPLGLQHDYPTAAVVQVADFFKRSNMLLGTKRRIAGLTLRATDAEWVSGSGPEVSGPMLSLLLAMTGRGAGCEDLTGAGVATLRSRT